MKHRWNFARSLLLLLTVVFFLAETATFYWGLVYLGRGLPRIKSVSVEEFATLRTQIFGIDDELDKLRDELYPLVSNKDNDFQKALIVNEWVMNQISGTEGDLGSGKWTPYAVLTAMREGKTAAGCGYRALLYLGGLKSIGIESRMIALSDDKGGTHGTVEVLIDDEWVVIDPTFNVHFTIDGKPASAVELHQLLLRNANSLEVIEGGEVLSSVKFDSPEYLLAFYLNVSMYESRHFFAWQALPILQYFFGIATATLDEENGTIENAVNMQNFMVLAYNFIFPIGFGISLIAFVVTSRRKRQPLNKNSTRAIS